MGAASARPPAIAAMQTGTALWVPVDDEVHRVVAKVADAVEQSTLASAIA